MDEASQSRDEPDQPSDQTWLDRICDQFEADWRAGKEPEVEDYLRDIPEPKCSALRRELEALDAEFRKQAYPEQSGADNRNRSAPSEAESNQPNDAEGVATPQRTDNERGELPADDSGARTEPLQPIDSEANEDEATEGQLPSGADPDPDVTAPFDSATGEAFDPTQTFTPRAGEGVLRYTVLRPHAQGGLGKVSVARDEELGREVAFKELRDRYADDDEAQSRFVLEAEITGSLEHPGIVPIYGLGRDANRRPFYAMRFIRGDSLKAAITRFHRNGDTAATAGRGKQYLQFRKLLNHFIDVCQAMQYAHSRGVLHRDIKPANIMLGEFGETLVVDWGLAKGSGTSGRGLPEFQQGSSGGSMPTQMGTVIGTPAYMSPEQAAGQHDQVGPASDIYSLGTTLFTLLAGKQAFPQKELTDILEAVREGDFPRPRELRPSVPVPLESICLKAMSRAPADRYDSCAELAEDIEHWLADEPVAAHRETLLQRASRWSRRHRTWMRAISSAVAAVAVVAVVAAIAVDQSRRNEQLLAIKNANLAKSEAEARLEAVARLRQARSAVDTWLTEASDALKFVPGVQHARQRLLEQAAADYERFTQQTDDDPDLELERARTYLRLGDVRRTLEQPQQAEKAYRRSIDLLAKLQQDHPGRRDTQVEWANAQTKLGVQLADLQSLPEADEVYTRAAQKLRGLVQSDPQDIAARDALATNRVNHANLLVKIGDDNQADSAFVESIDQFEMLCELAEEQNRFRAGLAAARSFLGEHRYNCGRVDEGLVEIRAAIETFSHVIVAEPGNPTYLLLEANALGYLGMLARTLGNYEEEQDCYERAAKSYENLAAFFPDVPKFRENLGIAWSNQGRVLHDRGRTGQAETILRKALEVFSGLVMAMPQDDRFGQGLLVCREALFRVLSDLGNDSEARDECELTLRGYEQFVANYENREFVERLAVCRSQYAQILQKLKQYEPAKQAFQSADGLLGQLINDSPEIPAYRDKRAYVQWYLGMLLWENGDEAEARTAFSSAQSLWETLVAQTPLPEFHNHLAWFLVNCPDSELRTSSVALASAQTAVGAAPENARYQATLGAALFRQEDTESAIAALQRAEQLDSVDDGRSGFYLAMALHQAKRAVEAREAFERAVQRMEASRPGNLQLLTLRGEAEKLLAAETQ